MKQPLAPLTTFGIGITILCLVAFTACTSPVHRQLEQIATFVDSVPERARQQLDSIDSGSLNRGDAALYALLKTQADYKCYVPLTSDSLIRTAVAYYTNDHDINRRMASLFYCGATFMELQMADSALLYFKKAEEQMQQATNNRLKILVLGRLASIDRENGLYEQSTGYFQKALEQGTQMEDRSLMVNYLINIGINYLYLQKPDSSLAYFERSCAFADSLEEPLKAVVYHNVGNYYLEYFPEKERQAENYLLNALQLSQNEDDRQKTYSLLASLYQKQGKGTKADSLWHRLLLTSEAHRKATIYYMQYERFAETGNAKEALACLENCVHLTDSIGEGRRIKEISEIQEKYDREVLERKALEARSHYLTIITLLAVAIASFFVFMIRQERKSERKIRQGEAKIKQYEKRLAQLEQEKSADIGIEKERSILLEQIEKQIGLIQQLRKQTTRTRDSSEQLYRYAAKCIIHHLNAKKPLNMELFNATDYSVFIEGFRLIDSKYVAQLEKNVHKLTLREKVICICIQLGMDKEQIIHFLRMDDASFRTAKSRLLKKQTDNE